MDVLSDILDAFELTGMLYFRGEFSAPFGLAVPEFGNAARFHIGLEGSCRVRVAGSEAEPITLNRGDLLVVPHGSAHTIADSSTEHYVDLDDALRDAQFEGETPFVHGGGGEFTMLVCGHFAFERGTLHPLLDALPPVLHFPARARSDYRWLDDAMRFLGDEVRVDRPGAHAVTSRMAEILFIQVLRAWVERRGDVAGPVAAIRDPHLGRALAKIHERPSENWTVARLAKSAGMSRTSFSEQFNRMVGVTPIQYVTQWRMEKAKAALRSRGVPLAEVAASVGYRSEASFNRAFRRHVGVGPGRYRAEQRA
ncbi:MAG: AraC family transcriptional regulator [Myxococcota bacterium]